MNAMKTPMLQSQPIQSLPRNLRNIGVAAHIDAGKTTLTERILLFTGAIHRAGDVHDGTTTTDFNPIEQRKGITIFAAAVSCTWTQDCSSQQGIVNLFPGAAHDLNLIDTPGHVDFTAEVERSLRALDGVIAVFCGVAGVQPQTETVWRQANRYHVPRIAFVNKMDRVGADFSRVVAELREKLGANAAPVLLPWFIGEDLVGQLDVINERAIRFSGGASGGLSVEDVPPELRPSVVAARGELVARLADLDETVANLWLDEKPVGSLVLKGAIRRATVANRFVPVIGGSAYKFVGIQPLIDAVVDYLPSPADIPSVRVHRDDGTEAQARVDGSGPGLGLVFKLAYDEQGRRMVFLRLYAGSLNKGDRVLNPRTGKNSRVGRIVQVFADRREEVEGARAGQIVSVIGLDGFVTGDTVCDPERPVRLEPPVFPEPVVSMAIEPRTSADRTRLAVALSRLSEEDPTFRTFTDPETDQSIIAGMGELHLEVIRERLEQEHHVAVEAGKPAIAYRESILGVGESDYLLKKQNGGRGMYARVSLRVRRSEPGRGVTVQSHVTGGNIPLQFMKSVRHGITDALQEGVLAGYPVMDAHVDILDGASHATDSCDLSFQMAARSAVRQALEKADPVLLEPIMTVEVDTPTESQGDLLGDLNRRRAKIQSLEGGPMSAVLKAEVPLSELWGYTNAIRCLSRGRASYSMTPSHFEQVPKELSRKIIDEPKSK